MKNRLLLTGVLALTACGPRDLNEGQRRYLLEDAEAAVKPALGLGPVAMALEVIVPNGIVDPALSAEDNAGRIAEHLSLKLACPSFAMFEPSPTSIGFVVRDCEADGRRWWFTSQLDVTRDNDGVAVRWLVGRTDEIDEVSIGANTRAVKRVASNGASTLSVTSDFLSSTALTFEGTAVVDPSTGAIVVNGNGNWKVSTETAHPVTLQNLTWTSPCAPETGSLDFAPLDVLVTENESIAVSRSVTFSAASPTDGTVSIQVGETTQQGKAELDYACNR